MASGPMAGCCVGLAGSVTVVVVTSVRPCRREGLNEEEWGLNLATVRDIRYSRSGGKDALLRRWRPDQGRCFATVLLIDQPGIRPA